MTSRLVQTAVFLVSALAIVGGALPSAAIEILTTLDNFEEGPFQVEDTTVDDGAESDFQQGLSNDNVLAGQRLVVGDLESGTRTSGDLTLSPDDDGVVSEFDPSSGGSRGSFTRQEEST